MEKATAIVLTNGMLDSNYAKTCHGLLRGTDRFELLAVIDHRFAGQDAGEVMDGENRGIPIYASVDSYFEKNEGEELPVYCVVGVASAGGYLPEGFRGAIANAINRGMSVVCGLHQFLNEDPEFSKLAREKGVELIDIRMPRPRATLRFWSGDIYQIKTPRIAVLGTDCAVGKRTTCRFLMEICQANGIKAEMIYTGQTGWMQGYPHGFIFDSTVNDFVSGEVERVIIECDRERQPDLILIEGQSALRNPTGPCGSEFLVSGDVKGVILQHIPGRAHFEGTEKLIPSVSREVELINMYGSRVLAVTLSEEDINESALSTYQKKLEKELGIPVVLPLREGLNRLLPIIRDFMETGP